MISQVVKEAVEFYVNSCADDLVEDRQKAAVVMSSWSPLEQMLSRAMSVSGLYHANQGTLAYRPRPAMLKSGEVHDGNISQDHLVKHSACRVLLTFALYITGELLQTRMTQNRFNKVPQDCRVRRGWGRIPLETRARANG